AWLITVTWAEFKKLFFLQYFPRAEQEHLKREYHSIRQTNTETSTEFMQRFLRLAGFLGAAAGTEEEQGKNFQWGLRRSTLNHLMCMPFTDVAQVANAARNYEILHEKDDDGAKRPDFRQKSGDRHQPTTQQSSHRNHGHNNDRHGSDKRSGSDNHRSSNSNYSGNNNRNSGNGHDQRNRGQQSNRSANSGNSSLIRSQMHQVAFLPSLRIMLLRPQRAVELARCADAMLMLWNDSFSLQKIKPHKHLQCLRLQPGALYLMGAIYLIDECMKKDRRMYEEGYHPSIQNSFFVYKDPCFESQAMSTSNAHQQYLVDVGSETRPPMLERGSYIPWASHFRRYLNRKRETRKWLNKEIDEGPYDFKVFTPSKIEAPRMQKEEDLRGYDLKHYEAKIEEMNLILIFIPNEIYNSVDACTTAKVMWHRVEHLIRGTMQNQVNSKHVSIMSSINLLLNQEKHSSSEKSHYVRNCPKTRIGDSKYFMEQMLLAKQDKLGVILIDEQNDFLFADASRMKEIKELSATFA
nr:zinc finger, CCHC-type, retrotransposon Gag domain protein [Tanacetum cinerariifolium]